MEPRGRTGNGSSNGNGNGRGNGHGHSHPPDEADASRSTASFTAPPTSEHEMTRGAQRGVVGFFDRALERWHALSRRGGRRMNENDAQLIARGARDRYMDGRYVESYERDRGLPGPRNEGAYTYPVPVGERGMERGRHYVNAPRRDLPPPPEHYEARAMRSVYEPREGSRPMRPPTVFEERYGGAPHWHRENERGGWDQAAYDNWDANVSGPSSAEGREQWSHPIPRDPRSDYFVPQTEDRRATSLAPFGERRDRHADERNRMHPAETAPWRGRNRGRW